MCWRGSKGADFEIRLSSRDVPIPVVPIAVKNFAEEKSGNARIQALSRWDR